MLIQLCTETGQCLAAWAQDEFVAASLCDKRLTRRLIKLATRFAEQPTDRITGTCGDAAKTKAA